MHPSTPADQFIPTYSRRTALVLGVVLLGLCLLPTVWAGDTPFIGDEPLLLGKAWTANVAGRWETGGLLGTRGIAYGPLPVWIYQCGISLTRDAVWLVRLRAVLFMTVTLGSLVWAARSARLPLTLVLCVAVSPYLLLYARLLWDNSFNIPPAILAVALAPHLRARKTLWPVAALTAVFGAMLLIHFMAAATVASVGLFAVASLPQAWRAAGHKSRVTNVVATVVVVATIWGVSGPYRDTLLSAPPGPVITADPYESWSFALLSPRLLTAVGVEFFVPHHYLDRSPHASWFSTLQTMSMVAYPLVWAGGVLTFVALFRRGTLDEPTIAAGVLGLLTVAAQLLLNGLTHTSGPPHYYNATWSGPTLLLGVTLVRLSDCRPWAGTLTAGVLAAVTASASLLIAIRLHTTGGTRQDPGQPYIGNYGPTITNQQQLVDELGPTGLNGVSFNVRMFVISVDALFHVRHGTPLIPTTQPVRRVIQYVHPESADSGRITLVPLIPATD